jgi:class 3 adenylate cyclase/tetratricopeptide (TPR) repeat protein
VPACANCGFESEATFGFCPVCGTKRFAGTYAREQRRTVTVLFCDLTGSTAIGESIDPERLRALLARYFEQMQTIVERHGGSVEKFIGDAVMAVFGVPMVHEDDALRAARAAVNMRDALPQLGLQGRIGVMTGEVVVGTEERLATGDAVNVAARLEQAAEPGQVLIGQQTLMLVQHATEVEPLEPLHLKGKADPVLAYRLLRVHDVPEREHATQFVGRQREQAVLREAFDRVKAERVCELVTVIGDAGVGKSRLVAEVLASVDATVVRGRCLPYGEGITYWPVVEVLKQLDVLPEDDSAAMLIRSLVGASETRTSAEDIAWAFRKTLEQGAADRPLVVVFDDIQWGEATFRDLIEHVALLSSGASILLLCIARPDLAESHPEWPVTLRLEPLGDEETEHLIGRRIHGSLRERIARAAGGNPLFIEEMLAMAEGADGDLIVPPTLKALLAARLDQLGTEERHVLERGAIEGEIFHRGAVQALALEEAQLTPRLAALVRKQLIKPDRPLLAGEDAFRFRHLLIRDAAYDALPKGARADLHERFSAWLERKGTALPEMDEILGYHLERAYGYRVELGQLPQEALAARARARLTAAGHRAVDRQDYRAAVSLYERALTLAPPTEIDLAVENELSAALSWTARSGDAIQRADALAERAASAGDRVGELSGRILAGMVRLGWEQEDEAASLSHTIELALPLFQAARDHMALYIAYSALSDIVWARGQIGAGLVAYETALDHARQANHRPPGAFATRAAGRFFGPTPISEFLAWLKENEPQNGRDHFFRAYRAGALAMVGRFDEAREILAEARADLRERGGELLLANITAFESVWVELWAGNPAKGAEFGAEGFRLHERLGKMGFMAFAAATLGAALYGQGLVDAADGWANRARELGASLDVPTQALWRQVHAKALAHRGDFVQAERLADEAVALCETTDMLNAHADAYADLAEVLSLAGRLEEAKVALGRAIKLYEQKGNIVDAQRARTRPSGVVGPSC